MFVRMFCVVVLGVLTAVAQADDAANQKELARFEKNWKIDSLSLNGNELPPNNTQNLTIRFKGKEMFIDAEVNNATNTTKFAINIDPNFDPGLFDLRIENEKRTLEGIYKFEGEKLKICVNVNGQSRPTEITNGEGANAVLVLSPKQ